MATNLFRGLSPHDRALVAISVLLDGREAENYLGNDVEMKQTLGKAALELAELPIELRMPLVGAFLRSAIEEISKTGAR